MKTVSGKDISKIGIGSFGIGGRGHRDVTLTEVQEDKVYINALTYSLEKGMNFTEISLGYGHGKAMRLFKNALDVSKLEREDIFLTHSLYLRDLQSLEVMKEDIDTFYKVMNTEYADSTLITESIVLKFGKKEVFSMLQELLKQKRTRAVSLSNASPDFISEFKQGFGGLFYAHEGHLSFEVRTNQDKGVFSRCDELNVKNIIWRPLGRSQTLKRNWELLLALSKKYGKSQSQIVLNWICHLGYNPMVLSLTKEHTDENLASTEFEMSTEDYGKITSFRPSKFKPLPIHWNTVSTDEEIVEEVNNFENYLDH